MLGSKRWVMAGIAGLCIVALAMTGTASAKKATGGLAAGHVLVTFSGTGPATPPGACRRTTSVLPPGPAWRLRSRTRPSMRTHGGIIALGTPTGTNCTGQSLGASIDSFTFEKLNASLSFTGAQLEQKGSLSAPAHGSISLSCGATTCDNQTCKDDDSAGDVPTTCTDTQSYMGEVKIQFLK